MNFKTDTDFKICIIRYILKMPLTKDSSNTYEVVVVKIVDKIQEIITYYFSTISSTFLLTFSLYLQMSMLFSISLDS